MGEVSVNSSGLLSKISSLFNNPLFSDITFIFTSNSGPCEEIYGHKLILALRSKEFAFKFYAEKESTSSVRIPACQKPVFELLLRFLYTDSVQFRTFEEAQDLYNLANTYDIEELKEKCYRYMLQDKITIKNIFPRYECALKKNIAMFLKDCRDFICSHAELVLKSKDFTSASADVVEDIIKQDGLLISTELDVINAVLNWGTEELYRKKMQLDEKQLREQINHFMKHLRFLTLSSAEFDNFVECHNILSAKESSVLTRKMLQPQCNVNIPNDICSITIKRGMICKNSEILNQFSLNYMKSDSSELIAPNCLKSVPPESIKHLKSDSSKLIEVEPEEFSSSRVQYEVKKCATYKEQRNPSPMVKQTKSWPSPSISSLTFCSSPLSRNNLKEYSFPLSDIEPCLELSFRGDIKCSVTLKVKNGFIGLRGFELKIKNEYNDTDRLEVFVHMTGFSEQLSKFYRDKLCKNIFRVMFENPMVLREEDKGELEVSIDGLLLNRCNACDNMGGKPYELNKGLDFAVEFYVKSNKKSNGGFLFLISKLLF